MRIAVICGYPIPKGMAATTRIFAYAKGLVASSVGVDVCSYMPNSFNADENTPETGEMDGVSYFYTFGRTKAKSRIVHGIRILLSLLMLGPVLRKRDRQQSYDALIVSTDGLLTLFYLAMFNVVFKKKMIFIFDEYPRPIRGRLRMELPRWKEVAYSIVLRAFSGYISMTQELLGYYQKRCYRPGIVVSTITDISRFRFNGVLRKQEDIWTLTYLGNMELSKDDVGNIISAFSLLLKRGYDVYLNLFGKPQVTDKQRLDRLISDLGVNDRVLFKFASYDEVPRVLCESSILVSSQPNTKRASGGFPTKLGEYLMAGRPALLSDVGETSRFFKHGEHMFFAPAEDPIAYAHQLEYIIEHYEEALGVAQRGRQLIIDEYSHLSAGIKIRNFLTQL